MKIKISELEGAALDYAVAVCEDLYFYIGHESIYLTDCHPDIPAKKYSPSSDWSQAGPIIEREIITTTKEQEMAGTDFYSLLDGCGAFGKTYLQSAMRCYVTSKLGDEVDVPEDVCSYE